MNNKDAVLQNLEDAGCDREMIEAFMKSGKGGWRAEQFRLLERHRRELLQAVHKEQKKIDCLDYLIYQMKKETEKEAEKGEEIL